MAPGTSSLLRARRRDVNVKPNRVLDRSSSRGMIYENEELRLRTININAEVEKGQHDIKKLRRENDQLRREIWNLRDEYDRLEALLKSKNISTDTEEEESEEDDACDDQSVQDPDGGPHDRSKDSDKLSVVEEEPEESSDNCEDKRKTVSFSEDTLTVPGGVQQVNEGVTPVSWPDSSFIPGPQIPVPVPTTQISEPGHQIPQGYQNVPDAFPAVPGLPMSCVTPVMSTTIFNDPVQCASSSPSYFSGLDSNLQNLLRSVNAGVDTGEQVLTPGGSEVVTTAILQRRQSFAQSGDRTKDTLTCATTQHTTNSPGGYFPTIHQNFYTPTSQHTTTTFSTSVPRELRSSDDLPHSVPGGQCEAYQGTAPSFVRLNSVQPFTLVFSVNESQLINLSVQEVIDSVSEQLSPELMHSLRGVRLVGGSCYLSFSSQQDADAALTSPLSLRGVPLTLEDASVGTTILGLSGVPHDVPDDAVAQVLSNFGSLVGPVERRVYKGVDTGERLVRMRARLAIPRWIWLEGCRVGLKIMRNEDVFNLPLSRRKSFRSHISVQLKPVTDDTPPIPPLPTQNTQSSPPIPPLPSSSNSSTPYSTTPPKMSFPSTNPFLCGSVPSIPVVPNTAESQVSYLSNASASTPNIFQESPFHFPTTFQTAESPGLRRINSVMGTMSLGTPCPPEAAHARSASSPPTITITQAKTTTANTETESVGQNSVPPSPNTARKMGQKQKLRKISKVSTDSRKTNGECSQTSSSDQDSPQKGRRRPSSVYFKQKQPPGILNRTTSVDQHDVDTATYCERERSNSDLSSKVSICKRKLSTTGRESGKVPWCGCWGNGCI